MLILCPIKKTVPNQQWRWDIPKTLPRMGYKATQKCVFSRLEWEHRSTSQGCLCSDSLRFSSPTWAMVSLKSYPAQDCPLLRTSSPDSAQSSLTRHVMVNCKAVGQAQQGAELWEAGEVASTVLSCRGPELISQHLHQLVHTTYNSSSRDLTPSGLLRPLYTHMHI